MSWCCNVQFWLLNINAESMKSRQKSQKNRIQDVGCLWCFYHICLPFWIVAFFYRSLFLIVFQIWILIFTILLTVFNFNCWIYNCWTYWSSQSGCRNLVEVINSYIHFFAQKYPTIVMQRLSSVDLYFNTGTTRVLCSDFC